jgi:predicted site-specific integrase-resolvase
MAETRREQRLIGYARISTYGQTLDNQLKQLRAAGYSSRNIYREDVTGAWADRAELLRMLDRLVPGDVVTVTRIDRLARSTLDLFGIVKRIVNPRRNSGRWLSRGLTASRAGHSLDRLTPASNVSS